MTGVRQERSAPRVSVVMAAYNAEKTIGAAISGVLEQSLEGAELIVVDDGSNDRTAEICRAYGDLIVYIRTENRGTSAARNTGIAASSGDYIAFCDSDDMLLPPYLQESLGLLLAAPATRRVVMNEAYLLTHQGTAHGRLLIRGRFPLRSQQRLAILQKNFVSIFAVFPRDLVEQVGLFDESLQYCEDWDFWIRAILNGWEVVHQSVPHALYRWTPQAKSAQMAAYDSEDDIMRRIRVDYADTLTEQELAFLDLRLSKAAPRLLDLQAADALREGDWVTARRRNRALAALSSGDRRTWARATVLGWVPLTGRLWSMRLRRIDQAVGRRAMEQIR